MKTAKYAVTGELGLTAALTSNTIKVVFIISPRASEKYAIREIIIAATAVNNAPLKGILNAWKKPPRTASLKAHRDVSLITTSVLSINGVFPVSILRP